MAELWYYTNEGKQMDPVTMRELKRLVGEGVLKPTDMVWKDGMPRWIRASSVKELFPDPMSALERFFTHTAQATGKLPGKSLWGKAAAWLPGQHLKKSMIERDETLPKGKSRPSAAMEDDSPAPRRGRNASNGGSSIGILLALIFGGGVLLMALVVGIVILIAVNQPEPNVNKKDGGKDGPGGVVVNPPPKMDPPPPIDIKNLIKAEATTYNLNLKTDQRDTRTFSFRKGARYEFIVRTQPNHQGSDADLYILSVKGGNTLAADPGPESDCRLLWSPPEDGQYRVQVHNCPRPEWVGLIACNVSIRETEPPPIIKEPELPPGVLKGSDSVDPKELAPGADFTFKVQAKANFKAKIQVTTIGVPASEPVDPKIQLFVTRDSDGKQIAFHTDPTVSPKVEFTEPATEVLTVRVLNGGGKAARCTVYYNVSP